MDQEIKKTEAIEAPLSSLQQMDDRYNRLNNLYKKRALAMINKIVEAGWFLVSDGNFLPRKYEEVLVVIDQRVSQAGDLARAIGNEPLVCIKHGYVSRINFNSEINEWSIQTCSLKSAIGSKLEHNFINGEADHIMFWRSMPKLPPIPKFLKEDFNYTLRDKDGA